MKPIELGTLSLTTATTELTGFPESYAKTDQIVIIVMGDQTEAIEFGMEDSFTDPVDRVASGTKDVIGPLPVRDFPRFVKADAATDVTLAIHPA